MRERELVYSIETLEYKHNDVQSQPIHALSDVSWTRDAAIWQARNSDCHVVRM